MSYVSAIVLAAGRGSRFKSRTPKPLAKVNAKPIIVYSLKTLSQHPQVRDIIIVTNAQNERGVNAVVRKYRISKVTAVVEGGRRRQDSVYNGLRHLRKETDIVLIHDGVRPFLSRNTISQSIKKAALFGAAVAAVPVKYTIKKVNGSTVRETIDRDGLWEIQTPQAFKKELILAAYAKFAKTDVTDDAMLVEKLGAEVKVCPGSYQNIKVTTIEDLVIAGAIAKRIG